MRARRVIAATLLAVLGSLLWPLPGLVVSTKWG